MLVLSAWSRVVLGMIQMGQALLVDVIRGER